MNECDFRILQNLIEKIESKGYPERIDLMTGLQTLKKICLDDTLKKENSVCKIIQAGLSSLGWDDSTVSNSEINFTINNENYKIKVEKL